MTLLTDWCFIPSKNRYEIKNTYKYMLKIVDYL